MASWKKVIVSGSNAELAQITASGDIKVAGIIDDALTAGRVTFAGANKQLTDDADLTFDGDTLSVKQITNASAVENSRLTGSFTGSFVGDGNSLDLSTNTTLPATDWDGTLNVGDVTGLAAASITGSLIVSSSDGGDGGIVTAKSFDVLSAGNVTLFGNVGDAELTVGAASTTVKLIGDVIELGNGSGDRVEVAGNLNVAGTASFNHSTNLSVVDKYILLNSGSAGANLDSGGIVIGGPNDDGKGELFGFVSGSSVDANGINRRWGIASDFDADTAGDFTADAFMSTVMLSSVEGQVNPDLANDLYKKAGNIFIDQTSGIPYIYV